MKNFVQPGENITLTAAAAASSGDGVLVGSLFGIAAVDAEVGDNLVLVTSGVFEMPKPATDVLAVGDPVYWDDAATLATADDDTGNNPKIGVAVTAAGNPSSSVRVRLNGTF
jgi:predicted RecA/RadA family phage recombinase